jgi:hypothetical protein
MACKNPMETMKSIECTIAIATWWKFFIGVTYDPTTRLAWQEADHPEFHKAAEHPQFSTTQRYRQGMSPASQFEGINFRILLSTDQPICAPAIMRASRLFYERD